jgi:hypothetical protein
MEFGLEAFGTPFSHTAVDIDNISLIPGNIGTTLGTGLVDVKC